MIAIAGHADATAAIGIANQRETIVAWDCATGEPLAPAIVWQDHCTAQTCTALIGHGHEATVSAATGLTVNASKIGWLLKLVPAARDAGERLMFGTIDSWLAFRLTGGLHVTDASNASRTMLMRLDGQDWDDRLCNLLRFAPTPCRRSSTASASSE